MDDSNENQELSLDFENVVNDIFSNTCDWEIPPIQKARAALQIMGHPDQQFKTILVAGTNGKGSTVEIISELLQAKGYRVGIYKSPHLVTPRERIRVNNEMIGVEDFTHLYRQIKPLNINLSFFQFMTVMACQHFANQQIDYAVMEVGIGGQNDATNAVDNDLGVITNIGFDHSTILGSSFDEIAGHKAGITPENGKLICGIESEVIEHTIEERDAQLVKPAELTQLGKGYFEYSRQEFRSPLKGEFQTKNLANALALVEQITKLPEDLTDALSKLTCEGRMEVVSETPLYLHDGAHNPHAIENILPDLPERFICLFNTASRYADEMLELINQKASKIILTNGPADNSKTPEELVQYTTIDTEMISDPHIAEQKALEYGKETGRTVIATGSLKFLGMLKKSRL